MISRRDVEARAKRVRDICEALPEVEVRSRQHHTFVVRGKKFAYFLVDHHGDDRVSLQCKAVRGLNQTLVESDPERFFLPPYMAHHGWIGLYLDVGPVDWGEVADFLTEAYKRAAPKTLALKV